MGVVNSCSGSLVTSDLASERFGTDGISRVSWGRPGHMQGSARPFLKVRSYKNCDIQGKLGDQRGILVETVSTVGEQE